MGRLIHFEEQAIARLRERLGAAEEAKQDLLAFARGHSGAVSSIHSAVLTALEAEDFDDLLRVVTDDWQQILGLDGIVLALDVGNRGFRCDCDGVEPIDPLFLARAVSPGEGVSMQSVDRGHPLFGARAAPIRAQALIRIDCGPSLPTGLLLLGQASALPLDTRHGAELLMFLGDSLAAIIRRWLIRP